MKTDQEIETISFCLEIRKINVLYQMERLLDDEDIALVNLDY